MTAPVRPRRSALYLPASNPRAIAKARTLPVDIVILDLEDAVAPEAKVAAREAAVAAARAGGWGGRELLIRANGLDTEWGAADLAAIAESRADGVLLPKPDGPGDLARAEAMLGDAPATLALWAMVETCAAVLALPAIGAAARGTRLAGLVMGWNDLAAEMRCVPGPDRAVFQPFLSAAVAAARVGGLALLDGVFNAIDDVAGLEAECRQGRAFGADGKTLIHPAQVAPCNAVFAPADAEIAAARAIVAAFDRPENRAVGVVALDGRMVERLHLAQARRLIALAATIRGPIEASVP